MNAMSIDTITPEITPHEECPEALGDWDRAGWAEIMAPLAHMLASLSAENRALRAAAAECATCGGRPCANPSFCALCREADARQRSKPRAPSRIPQDWDAISLDAQGHHFNTARPTPRTTIEGLMHSVRERGLYALKEPASVERLSRCDAAALAQIDKRIAQLKDAGR